jgi:hypothetical protein
LPQFNTDSSNPQVLSGFLPLLSPQNHFATTFKINDLQKNKEKWESMGIEKLKIPFGTF